MLRLFGIVVRLAFGLQVAIIVFVAMGIALIREAALARQGQPKGRRVRTRAASIHEWNAGADSHSPVAVTVAVERSHHR